MTNSIGYPADAVPADELLRAAARPESAVLGSLGSLGTCRIAVVALDAEEPGQMLVARAGTEDFSRAELDLLRGMARVLVMTLRMFARQQLLERLSSLQRMIVRRDDPREVLHAVVAGASELLDDDVVSLRLRDAHDPDRLVLVASAGADALLRTQIVLEITETALMRDVTETIACLRALKELGVMLAVDDFGTGYSSLDYLRRFPIDMLKIDKAFIDDLHSGDSTLAQAIIDLGESFELEVVAEGIEHEGQRQRLLELGCCFGQGYHFSPAVPARGISELLDPVALRLAG